MTTSPSDVAESARTMWPAVDAQPRYKMPRPIMVLDIETAPTPEALALPPDESFLMKGVSSTWKPDTVESHRVKMAERWGEEVNRRASLDWRLGRIVAAGVKTQDADSEILIHQDETELLRFLWDKLDEPIERFAVVGFNIRNFDLPWIMGRSGVHRIVATRGIDARKYGGGDVIDWSDILTNFGSFGLSDWTLGRYAEWFRFQARPQGDGADVPGWWANGETDKITHHLAADLEMCWELHHRFSLSFLPRVA